MFVYDEVRPREGSDRSRLLPKAKILLMTGCVQGAIIQLVCLSVCLCICVSFVVFTDCESCTRPVSTNPGSMEAGENELRRGTCFVARRLVVAVAGLLWITCVFWVRRDFFALFLFFSSNTNGLLQV